MNMVRVNINILPRQRETLDELVERTQVNLSEHFRRALDLYFKEETNVGRKEKPTHIRRLGTTER